MDPVFELPYIEPEWMTAARSGRWIAWTWFNAGPHADAYAVPTDGSSPPLRLSATQENMHVVSWTPDGAGVLALEDHDGDERYRLVRLDLARPGEPTFLTEAHPDYYLRGGDLHPNGRWLFYGANCDFAHGQAVDGTWLYRHDLLTGERLVLARPVKTPYMTPRLSPDGAHVIYARAEQHPAGRQVWIVDTDGQNDRELLSAGPERYAAANWFPDGQRLIALADTPTHKRLGVLDLRGQVTWLIDDPARGIEAAYVPFGSDRIVVIQVQGARASSSLLDPRTGREERLPDVPGNLVLVCPIAKRQWVGYYTCATQPDDFVRLDLDDLRQEKFVSLTRGAERTPLAPDDFAPAQDFHWRSTDGLEIQGWLYRPRGHSRGTIVYVHGGPTDHHEDRLNPEILYFVRAGFTVLDPNYRGSTGFGLPYREAIKRDGWGGAEQEDIRTGILALQQLGLAERGRVAVMGTSYGGYSAWHAITHCPVETVAAAIPICGMTDLAIDYETTRPDLRPYSEEMLGGSPTQVPDRYRERSPVNHVQNIRGKLMIVQGMQDPNVTGENLHAVVARLDAAGVAYELLVFEDEGHGIYKPENMDTLCRRVVQFLTDAFS